MNEIEKSVWEMHDSRLNDHEKRFERSERSFQEIEDQLKYIIGRMDNGMSPSMNEIKKDNSEIRVMLRDIDHKIEIQNLKMNDKIDTVESNLVKRIAPLEESEKKTDRIWWAIAAAIIVVSVGFVGTRIFENFSNRKLSTTDHVESLTTKRIR